MKTRKYLKVYRKFLHTSLASELEYKTNILIDLITAILSLIGSIFLLSIFFQNNGSIGGWKFEQALIIQAIYTNFISLRSISSSSVISRICKILDFFHTLSLPD